MAKLIPATGEIWPLATPQFQDIAKVLVVPCVQDLAYADQYVYPGSDLMGIVVENKCGRLRSCYAPLRSLVERSLAAKGCTRAAGRAAMVGATI